MFIDDTLAIGIGAAYGVIVSGIGVGFTRLWKSHVKLQIAQVEMLRLNLTDNDRRRDLWDKQGEVIGKQSDAIKDLAREVKDQGREIASLKAEIYLTRRVG